MAVDATLLTAVQTIASEIAIPVPQSVASPNQQVRQLVAQVNRAGEYLKNQFDWPVLRKFAGIQPASPLTQFQILYITISSLYTCDRIVCNTGWDATNHWRMVGPVTDEEWAQWKLGVMTQPIRRIFRMVADDTVEIFPAADGITQFALYFIQREWAVNSGPPIAGSNTATSMALDADYHLYNPRLLIVLAKKFFLEAKGLPYDDAAAEFSRLYEARTAFSRSARTISLGNRRMRHFVDYNNVPDTGYGS